MGRKITVPKYVGPKKLPENYVDRYNKFCGGDGKGLMQDDGRFMAYDKCRDAFKRYCKGEFDDEIMALHLYAFLSSWGMTTHNQYLMNKNYTCFTRVARALKENQDNWSKFSYNFCPDKSKVGEEEDYIKTVLQMKDKITGALDNSNSNVPVLPDGMTSILINKIIMVTYECVPAFDSHIKDEWRKLGYRRVGSGRKDWLNEYLLREVYEFADYNRQKLLELPSKNGYSVFKKIDMILWEK